MIYTHTITINPFHHSYPFYFLQYTRHHNITRVSIICLTRTLTPNLSYTFYNWISLPIHPQSTAGREGKNVGEHKVFQGHTAKRDKIAPVSVRVATPRERNEVRGGHVTAERLTCEAPTYETVARLIVRFTIMNIFSVISILSDCYIQFHCCVHHYEILL